MTAQTMRLDDCPATRPCVVCRREAGDGLGWFLLAENTWLDSVKVLRWHPTLAEQAEMRGVCCTQHLKTLLTHWLNCANLQFTANESLQLPVSSNGGMAIASSSAGNAKSLVGELAVYRESLSRAWSGSPLALKCILNSLIDGPIEEVPQRVQTETTDDLPALILPDASLDGFRLYAFQS